MREAVLRLLPDALGTVVYAVFDPASGDLVYANARPPAARHRQHRARRPDYLDDAPGTMLGAPRRPVQAETLRGCRGSAEETCATVETAFAAARHDDVCLLAAQLTGP